MNDISGMDAAMHGLETRATGLHVRAAAAAQKIAALLEAYAQANHPWRSRTGATGASVRGQIAEVTGEMIRITLSASMPYDRFLELAHDGRWAWLWPAIVDNIDAIRAILQSAMTSDRVGIAGESN